MNDMVSATMDIITMEACEGMTYDSILLQSYEHNLFAFLFFPQSILSHLWNFFPYVYWISWHL